MAAPDLLKLLAELARLPAEQRRLVASLLAGTPAVPPVAPTVAQSLDDRLPPGFEPAGGPA